MDRLVHGADHVRVVAAGRDLEALLGRVVAERLDDLPPRGGKARLRQVVAEEVDRRHQRLRLERQEARGAVEVVAVGVGVDLDLVADDLGVEDVGAAAEVDDVQDVDVLAKLGHVHVELAQAVGDGERRALARRADHEAGERHEAGEALRADDGLAATARAAGAGRAPVGLEHRARDDRCDLEGAAMAVAQELHALGARAWRHPTAR